MNQELLRIVENMARDKNIDKESVFVDLEAAMVSAAKKHFGEPPCEVTVQIDRVTGDITAFKDGKPIDIRTLGRISAQTAKQVMIQKLRTDERASIYAEFTQRKGQIITGIVTRYEGGTLVVNLNPRVEGYMPKGEQIAGQTYHPGERVRCLILDVREVASQIKIILSRTHPDFVRKLFELEVPEVAEKIIEMRALAREAGYRTKIAVVSLDPKVDPVGACVGIRGSRIKNIVDELGGEKIDIVRWDDSSKVLIANALMPAKVSEIALCFELNRATVVVAEDQLSLAIGKHGQNVRLAARLTDWDIDILTPDEYNNEVDGMVNALKEIEGVDDILIDKMIALGLISLFDVQEVGAAPLVSELGIAEDLAVKIVETAAAKADKDAAKAGRTQAQKVMEKEKPTDETST
jgi:N utilization substance protein A